MTEQQKATGVGSDVLGHPIRALTWAVNFLSQRGIALPKGFLPIFIV